MSRNDYAPVSGPACERHADALSALVEDDLDPRDRRPLDVHLAGCAACRDLLADLREIRSLAATLEPIEPPARAWHDVRRRIAAGNQPLRPRIVWSGWWSLGRAAAAGAAAIVAAILFIEPADLALPPSSDTPDHASRAAAAALEEIEGSHAAAIREVEQRIGTGAPIPAPARDVLTRNLALVDDAIAESRSAVEADPDAAIARERLQAGLARKLTLLRTMAALELEGG
jgi:hypothetical protein